MSRNVRSISARARRAARRAVRRAPYWPQSHQYLLRVHGLLFELWRAAGSLLSTGHFSDIMDETGKRGASRRLISFRRSGKRRQLIVALSLHSGRIFMSADRAELTLPLVSYFECAASFARLPSCSQMSCTETVRTRHFPPAHPAASRMRPTAAATRRALPSYPREAGHRISCRDNRLSNEPAVCFPAAMSWTARTSTSAAWQRTQIGPRLAGDAQLRAPCRVRRSPDSRVSGIGAEVLCCAHVCDRRPRAAAF